MFILMVMIIIVIIIITYFDWVGFTPLETRAARSPSAAGLRDETAEVLGGAQSYIRKGIGRQGIGSFCITNPYVSTLRPVVMCPYLCTSEFWAEPLAVV